MAQIHRKLNYKFARRDPRDFQFKHIMKLEKKIELPPVVDLREKMPPVYDQGDEGSCTAHAIVAHKEFLDMRYVPRVPMSRQFVYYCERVREGDPGNDSGADLRDGCEVLLTTGVCAEKLWPYKTKNMYHAPTKECYEAAKAHLIGAYYAINTAYEMRKCLANGYPFVFGLRCPRQLTDDVVEETGVLPMVTITDATEDGHAILCVGYDFSDPANKFYWVRNSWGKDWGLDGYFKIPAAVMENQFWVDDRFTMRLAHQPGL